MSIFNKISKLLKHNDKYDIESDLTQRIQLLNFCLIGVLFFSLIYSLVHLFFFDKINGIVILSFFILFALTLVYFKTSLNYKVSIVITLSLITLLFIYLIFSGVGENSGILWGLAYPVVLSLLIDFKRSSFFSLFFLVLTTAILILSNSIEFGSDYSIDIIIRFFSVYIFIFLIIQFYVRVNQQVSNIKEKKNIDTERKLSEKNKYLSNLSYQIRTPLNNITGILNLQRNSLSEEVLEEVELSVSNLITIINSIPDAFDKKLIPIKSKKGYFNFNNIIKKSLTLFQTEQYDKLKFSHNLSNKVPAQVYGDRMLVIQIIISVIDFLHNNLSSNILKFEVISKEENNKIILDILCKLRDERSLKKLNIPITEIKNIELRELKIIQDLVKTASGKFNINVENTELSFSLIFDFSEEKEITKETSDKKEVILKEDIFNGINKIQLKNASILIVEDDIMNGKVMTLNLNKHVNKIIIAENGKEALTKYASTKIDLILMDIRMPLMDGFKTTEKIREAELGTDSQTPIIAVTANVTSEVKKKCYAVGMNDFTTKPINFKVLLKKMKALLEE